MPEPMGEPVRPDEVTYRQLQNRPDESAKVTVPPGVLKRRDVEHGDNVKIVDLGDRLVLRFVD